MPDRKHVVIGGLCLPLDVEALESLPVDPGGLIQFDFAYQNIRFAVRYAEGETDGILKIVGDVGPLPFSAEAPAARAGLVQIVLAANDVLESRFRLVDGRILLGAETNIDRPVTATKLIAAVAAALITAQPYLDLISVYIRPPLAAAAPGEAALRPEWRRKPIASGKR